MKNVKALSLINIIETIPFLDIEITNTNLSEIIPKLIEFVRPQWKNTSIDDIKWKDISDGYTNRLLAIYLTEESFNSTETFILRINGNQSDLFIDRNLELSLLIILSEYNCAQKVYLRLKNGICYDFIPGSVCDYSMVSSPHYFPLIAKEFARIHSLSIEKYQSILPFSSNGFLFPTMKKLINLLPKELKNLHQNTRYQNEYPNVQQIENEINFLENLLEKHNFPLAICHNDALYKNFIYSSNSKRFCMIDYEFAAVNYPPFDIGNHFMEFAGMENIDFGKYPDKQFQWQWIKYYLAWKNYFTSKNSSGGDEEEDEEEENDCDLIDSFLLNITNEQIQQLFMAVNHFALVSHILWGLVAVLQSQNSFIQYDFLGFAITRWRQYLLQKPQFLQL